jgi:hypothetical protein
MGAGTSIIVPSASPEPVISTSPAVSSNNPVRTGTRRLLPPETTSTA